MQQLDSDGSGEIEFDEFHKWWQSTDSFEKLSTAKTDALQTAVELCRSPCCLVIPCCLCA
jgi:hypothetical protein